ncbi:hypothetical protein CK203_057638 [Vitis vinifera]|uniref:Uncharacterized protein n=1 Tax=Vitis vinifera TaxID=29760 RepID=A0A438GVQ9_VITVI|nr:hypothetical protein CK203_057638 [Vitis vinifera]
MYCPLHLYDDGILGTYTWQKVKQGKKGNKPNKTLVCVVLLGGIVLFANVNLLQIDAVNEIQDPKVLFQLPKHMPFHFGSLFLVVLLKALNYTKGIPLHQKIEKSKDQAGLADALFLLCKLTNYPRRSPSAFLGQWVPQDLVATGGKCLVYKWVTGFGWYGDFR